MSMLRKEKQKKVTMFQFIFSIGLFVATLLMWLIWDNRTFTVLLTGIAALTMIINSYQQMNEKDPNSGYRYRRY